MNTYLAICYSIDCSGREFSWFETIHGTTKGHAISARFIRSCGSIREIVITDGPC